MELVYREGFGGSEGVKDAPERVGVERPFLTSCCAHVGLCISCRIFVQASQGVTGRYDRCSIGHRTEFSYRHHKA